MSDQMVKSTDTSVVENAVFACSSGSCKFPGAVWWEHTDADKPRLWMPFGWQ